MKPSYSYSLLKFVYFTGQWHHSLEVHPFLRKILDPPLQGISALPVSKCFHCVLFLFQLFLLSSSEFDISLCITCCEKDWDITVGAVYVDRNLAAWFHWLEVLWLWSHYPFWKYLLVDFWRCRLTVNDLTKGNIRQKWYWGLNWLSCISLINVEDFTIHIWTQFQGEET